MKKIKKNEYRCACCDEIKSNKSQIFVQWTQKVKPERSQSIAICRKCNNKMKKRGVIGLLEFKNWYGGE